jgi:ABC-type protease/lipase transport system fused ATPase/permease subunit
LARAVFGTPSLVVLDEPSSNLDSEGDAALASCIIELKRRGTTVVVISHRPATLAVADRVLVLKDGVVEAFGGRSEIVGALTRPVPVPASGSFATPLFAEAR